MRTITSDGCRFNVQDLDEGALSAAGELIFQLGGPELLGRHRELLSSDVDLPDMNILTQKGLDFKLHQPPTNLSLLTALRRVTTENFHLVALSEGMRIAKSEEGGIEAARATCEAYFQLLFRQGIDTAAENCISLKV